MMTGMIGGKCGVESLAMSTVFTFDALRSTLVLLRHPLEP
jgi:hypothetical protein